ncbi:four-helix bundle copper-binding protein [Arthrobacter sp. SA17]
MTHHISAMLYAHPKSAGMGDKEKLAECIGACFECSQACTACADACLGEEMIADLARCIRTDLDCAEICSITGNVLSRRTADNGETTRALLEVCRTACSVCAEECQKHAGMHDHCRICAEACRRCEAACADLLTTVA